jgi:chromosome segregation ATPase
MMDEFKSPDPLVLLLNEIDILLAQMRLMELCVQQAQTTANYERERAQQKHEAELAAIRYTLAESQRVPTDGSAEAVEAKLLENLRTIEDELNRSRVSYQSQIESLQHEVAVRERALTERQEAVSAVELALHGKIQVLQQDLARLRSENASLREKTAQAEELRRQPGGDHQREPDLQKDNGNLQTALSAAQALQRNTEAKLDQLRLRLAEAQLIVESRTAEIGDLKKQLVALNQQLAQRASVKRPLQNRLLASPQNQDRSRFEIEQSLREELERLLHEAEEKGQILQTRNDELVTVKASMEALQERLNETEITLAENENAALAELERMRSEFQAQLALLQAELSQKDWALQEREALSQSLEQNYRRETDSLRQLLEEEKARKVRATEEFTIGEIRLGPAGDVELASQIHDHHDADSSAQRRRWHTDFVWKRRWKASETK